MTLVEEAQARIAHFDQMPLDQLLLEHGYMEAWFSALRRKRLSELKALFEDKAFYRRYAIASLYKPGSSNRLAYVKDSAPR